MKGKTDSMSKYYDGTKLLSLSDINGEKPEIYMCTTNRTGGKTTYFSKLLVNRFRKYGEKFMLISRFSYEMSDIADKFFKDIQGLFFKDYIMTAKRKADGVYYELFLCKEWENPDTDGKSCGYAVDLNHADSIKKFSHLFSDVARMFMDEFQSETNHYCTDEIKKLQSIHASVARGKGEQVRYVPLYMCANPVSLINPYYVVMGITTRLNNDTRFLRGDGWVLEQGFNESACEAQKQSGFNRAFANSAYTAYASEAVYLNDNSAFIDKPKGKSNYLCTIKYNNCEYGLREFQEEGIIYCDDHPDTTYKNKLCVTTADHNVNYVMLKRNDLFVSNMRYYFERGCFRFKDLRCKEAILKTIAYY